MKTQILPLVLFVMLIVIVPFASALEERIPDSSDAPLKIDTGAIYYVQDSGFIPNIGQYDPEVAYVLQYQQTTIFFTRTGLVLAHTSVSDEIVSRDVIRQSFGGVSPKTRITAHGERPGRVNYYVGNDSSEWLIGIPVYAEIVYNDLYPGIDLVYAEDSGRLKREFRVSAGASPSEIELLFDKDITPYVDDEGTLRFVSSAGEMLESPLICWQVIGGEIIPRSAVYLIEGGSVRIALKDYNPEYEMIIDPELVYSTFLGGSKIDDPYSLAPDGSGGVWVVGFTDSTNFPVTTGAYQSSGDTSDFISRFSSNGTLLYSTYLGGGNSTDIFYALASDGSGGVWVVGMTASTNFPVTADAYQTSYGGWASDGFISRFSSNGTLLYSTYLGGDGQDRGNALAPDGSGGVWVAGTTDSTNFPVTADAYQSSNNGGYFDTFVSRFSSNGTLLYSTYLGGDGQDRGNALAPDGSGGVWVAGRAWSTNFPVTANAYHSSHGGGDYDTFVSRFLSSGTLLYSTYLGGNSSDCAYALAPDGSGGVWVAGGTGSTNFPVTANAYHNSHGGGDDDAFVSRFLSSGILVYSTYLGGNSSDCAYALAPDGSGGVWVTGETESSNFPVTPDAYQSSYGGSSDAFGGDAFVVRFSDSSIPPTITTLTPSTITAGSDGFTLEVTGTNFVDGAKVLWEGQERATVFISTTKLTTTILQSDVANAGTYTITVVNPDGVGSGELHFEVTPSSSGELTPPPTLLGPGDPSSPGSIIDTLAPQFNWTVVPYADEYGLYIRNLNTDTIIFDSRLDGYTITGNTFSLPSGILQPDTHYRWNMNSHSSAGWNDDLVSGHSQKLYFTTPVPTTPVPTSPTPIPTLPPQYKVYVNVDRNYDLSNPNISITFAGGPGMIFVTTLDCEVTQSNGNIFTGQFEDPQIGSQIVLPGSTGTDRVEVKVQLVDGYNYTIFDEMVPFQVIDPPIISTLTPSSIIAGSDGFTLEVTGTNFVEGAKVLWGGQERETEFVSASKLIATILSVDLVSPGTYMINVKNPDNIQSNEADFFVLEKSEPRVITFTINDPLTRPLAEKFTIYGSVEAGEGATLERVELWGNGVNPSNQEEWEKTDTDTSIQGELEGTYSFEHSPETIGDYWYGIHVVDSNTWAHEGGGQDLANGKPIKVTVTQSTSEPAMNPDFSISPNDPMFGGQISFTPIVDIPDQVKSITWEWGDETSSDQWVSPNPLGFGPIIHQFELPRKYAITLTIIDNEGHQSSKTKQLDLSLKAGDILIDRNFLPVPGYWSHVALYSGPETDSIIEAANEQEGVRELSVSDLDGWWRYPQATCTKVLRVKDATDAERQAAVEFARQQVIDHKKFLPAGAAWLSPDEEGSQGWWCSELVWASYLHGTNNRINLNSNGIDDFYRNDAGSLSVTPTDIFLSPNVEVIGGHTESVPKKQLILIFLLCPVSMNVTDPIGRSINRNSNEIPYSWYYENNNSTTNDTEKVVIIPVPLEGNYHIDISREDWALDNDIFSLLFGVTDENGNENTTILALNQTVVEIPNTPYIGSIHAPPYPCFNSSTVSGTKPLEVHFFDLSINNPENWNWSFGDGSFSNLKNPIHTYENQGNYTISLSVTNKFGENKITEMNYITVLSSGNSDLNSPISISNLTNITYQPDYINWTWTDPVDVDFDHVMVYVDGLIQKNVTQGVQAFTATGLIPSTTYTIGTRTVGTTGLINETWVNHTAMTASDPGPSILSPEADFNASITSGEVPLSVQFNDQSIGEGITNWLWSFGDGETSTEINPLHIYTTPSIYTVSLQVTNEAGTNSSTRTNYINATQSLPLVQDFECTPLVGNAPLGVVFTDTSTGMVTTRLWDFGDGITVWKNETDTVSHTYSIPGTYTVLLTLGNEEGQETITKTEYIQVNPTGTAPVARFIAVPMIGYEQRAVRFSDRSTGTPLKWQWDFGDGSSSSEQNPSHVYTTSGRFVVILTVFNSGGSDSYSSTVWMRPAKLSFPTYNSTSHVIVKPPILHNLGYSPISFFTMDKTFGSSPMTVQFTDMSFRSPSSWEWDFDDGETSTLQNPTHTYNMPGTYSVSLTVKNSIGESTTSRRVYVR